VKDLALQMANILAHLHSQNPPLVHRDFTPENLILDENGILKLIDFNVAQELEEGSTRTIVGKHAYLPPEQFRGKACPQSDIYAYGATLHYLLTGEEPEPISCSHPILINEAILPEFEKIVSQATELELADRTRDAQELIESLKVFKQEESAPV
jgi:serine/threonine protein kinase